MLTRLGGAQVVLATVTSAKAMSATIGELDVNGKLLVGGPHPMRGVKPIIETMPLERAAEAYDRMLTGKARFRMVLTTRR